MEIRRVRFDDAKELSRIRKQDAVRKNILAITSERTEDVEKLISSLRDEDVAFAAVENGILAGVAILIGNTSPHRCHSGSVSVVVDSDRQNAGIGTSLMKAVLNYADKTLALHRLEFLAFTDNAPAIALCRKLGFEIEAIRKNAAVKDGKFADEYLMARLNGGRENVN